MIINPGKRYQTCIERRLTLRSGAAGLMALGISSTGLAAEVPSYSWEQSVNAWRNGGWVLMMRHEQTVPGVGDPPGYRLEDCATQRNLSEAGLKGAVMLGGRFREAGLQFAQVRSSQWCRCVDTAKAIATQAVAAQTVQVWPALNSFFDDRAREPAHTRELQGALTRLPASELWLWVTHQVNITALAGVVPAMGEGIALRLVKGQPQAGFRWRA